MGEGILIHGTLRHDPNASPASVAQRRQEFLQKLQERPVAQRKDAAWFDNKSGGYYIMQHGHNYRKEEVEAAHRLAQNGFQVVMQPEGDGSGGVSLKISKAGTNTYPEGTIGSLWYEQHSAMAGGEKSVFKGLMHAHEKGVQVPVIYDRGKRLRREHVEDAIAHYRRQPTRTPKTNFKEILVVGWEHKQRRWRVFSWDY